MNNWIDKNLNDLGVGICLIIFGFLFSAYGKFLYNKIKKKGYKPFKIDSKTSFEDSFSMIVYIRILGTIFIGIGIIFLGILKFFSYFDIINF